MSKGVRTSTIEKLKSGQTVSLYSHYYGAWDAEEKRFLVYYKDYTYPTMPQKLIGIVQVSVDTDGIPVLDTKRLPIANNSLIPLTKKYVFAIFGIAIESTKSREYKLRNRNKQRSFFQRQGNTCRWWLIL
mgnify:CR=1 FL=1